MATTYLPLAFETQVRESDGAVIGTYVSHNYKQVGGQIVTEYRFKIEKFVGPRITQNNNNKFIQFLVPGGEWQGMSYSVSGTPAFSSEEKVLLLLSQSRQGLFLTNLSLGVYRESLRANGERFFTSVIFPNHPQLSRLEFDFVQDQFQRSWGRGLAPVLSNDFFVRTGENTKQDVRAGRVSVDDLTPSITSRSPASADQAVRIRDVASKKEKEGYSLFWIMIFFFLLGLYGAIARKVQINRYSDKS